MHHPYSRVPQPRPELPGITPAVRGNWQAVGNAGVVCQCMAWALCLVGPQPEGRQYGLILSLLGICGFLAEFYGRLRWRKKQLPFPRGYSFCRYPGFALAAAGSFVQRQSGQTATALPLLCVGLALFWASLVIDKLQRRRWREQREMEEL